jgi:peroxiredoxin/outer membrane lipoprotein-sorting protein
MRIVALLAALTVSAFGQTAPEILKQVAETYRSLKSYRFEAQVVTESVSASNESRSRSTRVAAAILPDRRRLESKGGQQPGSLRVYDGHTVWEFRPGVNQFARQDQATYNPPKMTMLSDPVDAYKALDKADGAKLVREESIEAAGGSRPCWVLEVPAKFRVGGFLLERSPTTYWVDKSTNLVLQEKESTKMKMPTMDSPQTSTTTTTYTVARIDEPLPDELFQFQPPATAAEVAEFTSPFGGGSPLVGRHMPQFTLQDLAGNDVAASSLEGKPVLVNFWATWCGPCREQMPKIQEAQRAFADKGLVVLAINDGEPEETARTYIEEHKYTFRVLLDRDKTIAGKFSVSGIPALFLIDRDGNIRAQFEGYNSALDLREELKKIGL